MDLTKCLIKVHKLRESAYVSKCIAKSHEWIWVILKRKDYVVWK